MRVALCQIDTTVGDFEGNARKIRGAAREARAKGAELILFPEQCIPGYPARDFLELGEFVEKNVRCLEDLARDASWYQGANVVVGFAEPHSGPGAGLYNSAALLEGGRIARVARKSLLPTYDVFDEARYFDPAPEVTVVGGQGLSICEDVWNDKRFWARLRYARDPVEEMVAKGARLVVNISASPFATGKPALREKMLAAAARNHGVPLLYVNLVGGNDALVFDGHSVALDAGGRVVARARGFREEVLVLDAETGGEATPLEHDLDMLMDALVLGARDYARKTGFKSAVVGMSGGVDSALTAVIAARALGPENVTGVAMPSRYSAPMSREDAEILARRLGIHFLVVPIEPMLQAFLHTLKPAFAGLPPDVTEENLQARIRGTILMALSNKTGALLLSTGNKSELSVGYCTLYGDMAGGLAVIGDVPKTTVYALARHLNAAGEIIPARTIERPPSAELRADQTDQDTLPPYEVLDPILAAYVEERLAVREIVARGFDEALVRRVLSMVARAEYKRRQAAPTIRVSAKAFGEGWRFPIAHGYRI